MRELKDLEIIRANNGLVSTKMQLLEKDLNKELATFSTISSLMPVLENSEVHSLCEAASALRKTMNTLSDIYESEFTQSPKPIPFDTTSSTWSRLQQTVQNQPNCLLWTNIRSTQEENIVKMKALFKDSARLKHFAKDGSSDFFDLYLVKARAKHLAVEFKRISVVHELENSTDQFIALYDDFLNRVYMNKDLDSDIVDEYLLELTMQYYNCGQLDYLTSEIEMRQAEYSERSSQLNKHNAIIAELQKVYAEESQTFHQTRDICAALFSIKQKLQSLETNAKGLFLEARESSQRAIMKQQTLSSGGRMLNNSVVAQTTDSSSSSFNLSINGALSSTRLDGWPNENSMLMLRYYIY